MDTADFKRAIEQSERFLGALPSRGEVEAELEKLKGAYDELTNRYMDALERLEHLLVTAPDKAYTPKPQRMPRKGTARERIYQYLITHGPTRTRDLPALVEMSRASVTEALKRDRRFRNVSWGLWEAIPIEEAVA